MFWRKSIAARVAQVIENRVIEAQKSHDIACKAIDEEAEAQKEIHADAMVAEVIGK